MPNLDVQSQSTLESSTTGTSEALRLAGIEAAVEAQVAACEKLVDKAVEKGLAATSALRSSPETG